MQHVVFLRVPQGCVATICMPVNTPDIKVANVRRLGGLVELVGESYQEAQAYAQVSVLDRLVVCHQLVADSFSSTTHVVGESYQGAQAYVQLGLAGWLAVRQQLWGLLYSFSCTSYHVRGGHKQEDIVFEWPAWCVRSAWLYAMYDERLPVPCAAACATLWLLGLTACCCGLLAAVAAWSCRRVRCVMGSRLWLHMTTHTPLLARAPLVTRSCAR